MAGGFALFLPFANRLRSGTRSCRLVEAIQALIRQSEIILGFDIARLDLETVQKGVDGLFELVLVVFCAPEIVPAGGVCRFPF